MTYKLKALLLTFSHNPYAVRYGGMSGPQTTWGALLVPVRGAGLREVYDLTAFLWQGV